MRSSSCLPMLWLVVTKLLSILATARKQNVRSSCSKHKSLLTGQGKDPLSETTLPDVEIFILYIECAIYQMCQPLTNGHSYISRRLCSHPSFSHRRCYEAQHSEGSPSGSHLAWGNQAKATLSLALTMGGHAMDGSTWYPYLFPNPARTDHVWLHKYVSTPKPLCLGSIFYILVQGWKAYSQVLLGVDCCHSDWIDPILVLLVHHSSSLAVNCWQIFK